ncbi:MULTISPECIES: hypothetical protein [unclassified Brenneria]|uniref:hypothetical protein n=1 Tax=unclassified Brenneria TaxID=2634434 RepID=UPI001552F731|nr:hypothetical protein [Brenneria sp. hezel4-2-4]MEE3649493.1 hypothetical protein [Brenneria sp. HEZEL_4_2_4]NPC99450.1 hypothetical protein [Brenneria sp. hezel4-2-4]
MKRRSFLKGLIGVSLVGIVSKEAVAAACSISEDNKSKTPTPSKKKAESDQTMRFYDENGVLRVQIGMLDDTED